MKVEKVCAHGSTLVGNSEEKNAVSTEIKKL